jgi:transposase
MYFTNSERNRVIYELWEKNLTVEEISSNTGIPRSTVGYYVRKFNKLAAKGKPVVFPGPSGSAIIPTNYTQDIQLMSTLETRILESVVHGDWEGLYYRLSAFRHLKELGLLTMRGQANFLSSLERWLDYAQTDAQFDWLSKIVNDKRD